MQCSCTVLCCHLWPVWPYHIFPHYLISGTIFGGKNVLNIRKMRVSVSSTTRIWNRSHYKRIKQDVITNIHRSTYKEPLVVVSFELNENTIEIFEKYSNIILHDNPSSGCRLVPCRLTNGKTDTRKILIAFHNFTNTFKTTILLLSILWIFCLLSF
jgi:hypothetical protein